MSTNKGAQKVKAFLYRIGLPAVIVSGLLLIYTQYYGHQDDNFITRGIEYIEDQMGESLPPLPEKQTPEPKTEEIETLENYWPASSHASMVQHTFFSLSYDEQYEQAEWVAYELDKSRLTNSWVERTDRFREDPKVQTGSAGPNDYRHSGFDRGHLAPAADMAFSKEAMKESFYMSNISPQVPAFNRGIWKELEEQTRDWCKANEHLYVITGPVLKQRAIKRFGPDKGLAAPRSYYKILLDLKGPEKKAVGFVMPNKRCEEPLHDFMMSVDEVEEITGLDFFQELPDKMEEELESNFMESYWITDYTRFQRRLIWNKQAAFTTTFE